MSEIKAKADDTKYAAFDHTFEDRWAGTEKSFSFRFRKPGRVEIRRFQKTAMKKPAEAQRNLLVDLVHPDDRVGMEGAVDEYEGVTATLASAVLRSVGFVAEGN